MPNVFPVYAGGQYVLNTYGVSGNPAQSNVFCGINKTDDGSRTAEKGTHIVMSLWPVQAKLI